MSTRFESLRDELEKTIIELAPAQRALFLLAYAERFTPLFAQFQSRLKSPMVARFEEVVAKLWAATDGGSLSGLSGSLDALIPGEEWMVDGFHDALAQYIGGLAWGALTGLESGTIDGEPERGVFDLLRLLLSEMRLGCSEPGDDDEGENFERELDREQLIVDEAELWREIALRVRDNSVSTQDLHKFAVSKRFDPERLEPELTEGLRADGIVS